MAKPMKEGVQMVMLEIRRLRFEKNEMTQQELADLIGTSRMTVYSIETGKYVPSTVLALKIVRIFWKTCGGYILS